MKFIRDIISEKANLAGRAGRGRPTDDMTADMVKDLTSDAIPPRQADDFPADLAGPDIDIIHKVASGSPSLNGAPEYAFAAEEPADSDPDLGPPVAYEADLTPDSDYSDMDNDDLNLSSPPAPFVLQDDEDHDDADELFGDLWADTPTDNAKSDLGMPDDDMATSAEIETPAPVSEPETAARPVSAPRKTSARPATRAILSGAPLVPQESAPTPAPETSSPFQRITQRDKHLPSSMPPRRVQPASDIHEATARDVPPEMSVEIPKTIKVPAPAAGRAARHAGRVKTRLLGFNTEQDNAPDPFDNQPSQTPATTAMYPVGWMVVTDGPGRGNAFTLFDGVSQIGRGEDQAIRLDFGDNSISRSSHAAIAYDGEQQAFFLGHGGKANLVRLNGNPVLSTEKLNSGALIRIGETTLRFVALCGNEFDWGSCQDDDIENAQFG